VRLHQYNEALLHICTAPLMNASPPNAPLPQALGVPSHTSAPLKLMVRPSLLVCPYTSNALHLKLPCSSIHGAPSPFALLQTLTSCTLLLLKNAPKSSSSLPLFTQLSQVRMSLILTLLPPLASLWPNLKDNGLDRI
jgi:hypothetical protein